MPKEKIKLPSIAFLVCLAVAAIAWGVVTFSKDYKVSYNFKIVCYNLPEGKKSVTVSDTVIALTFNQKGLKYLSSPFKDKEKKVYISVAELVKSKHKATVYTFSNKEMREFLLHHNFGSELVSVDEPEVITFYVR